jgi:hypothetical protein
MRPMVLAALLVAGSLSAAVGGSDLAECGDRNALNSVSVDARLVAVRLYYQGLVHGLADESRRACYEAQVVKDDKFVIINKALDLIEDKCLPIDVAARLAAQSACP